MAQRDEARALAARQEALTEMRTRWVHEKSAMMASATLGKATADKLTKYWKAIEKDMKSKLESDTTEFLEAKADEWGAAGENRVIAALEHYIANTELAEGYDDDLLEYLGYDSFEEYTEAQFLEIRENAITIDQMEEIVELDDEATLEALQNMQRVLVDGEVTWVEIGADGLKTVRTAMGVHNSLTAAIRMMASQDIYSEVVHSKITSASRWMAAAQVLANTGVGLVKGENVVDAFATRENLTTGLLTTAGVIAEKVRGKHGISFSQTFTKDTKNYIKGSYNTAKTIANAGGLQTQAKRKGATALLSWGAKRVLGVGAAAGLAVVGAPVAAVAVTIALTAYGVWEIGSMLWGATADVRANPPGCAMPMCRGK
jgi:hypothetical protein